MGLGDKIEKNYINQTVESSSSTMHKLNKTSKYLKKKLKILNIKNRDEFYQRIPVKILTLDHFIDENHIKQIDLLKIDTEGFEYNVIKSIGSRIYDINLIHIEHHFDDMIIKNYTLSDIHAYLKNKGFIKFFKIKMKFRKSFEYLYRNKNFKI